MTDFSFADFVDRVPKYNPWWDVGQRTAVRIDWFDYPHPTWGKVLGLTNFERLTISLSRAMNESQQRCVLTHELIHLERGPLGKGQIPAELTRREESHVNSLTARRLVDPVIWKALLERHPEPSRGQIARSLRVDVRNFLDYSRWRRRVTERTAMRTWDSIEYSEWPAPWMRENAHLPAIGLALAALEADR